MEVRRAVAGDTGRLAALTEELGYDPGQFEDRLADVLADPGAVLFVADVDGEVVGWAHVHVSTLLQVNQFAELSGLVVAEGVRGRGIGAALVEASVDWARGRDLPELRVRSNAVREGAHRFYEGLGFEVEKTSLTFVRPL